MPDPDLAERTTPAFGPGALLTPANVITVARLLSSPIAFGLILAEKSSWRLTVLWVLLTATDSLDGYLARRQGTTRSGAFLDPLADKVLALGGLWSVVIAGVGRYWWLPVAAMTVREAVISAFRAYWGRRGLAIPASRVAKMKTFLQFGAVGWFILPLTHSSPLFADSFVWLAVVVAWVSAVQYLSAGSRATSSMDRT